MCNVRVFLLSFFLIGCGSLVFHISWYAAHPGYLDMFEFSNDHNVPRWYFPSTYPEHMILIIVKLRVFCIHYEFENMYKYIYENETKNQQCVRGIISLHMISLAFVLSNNFSNNKIILIMLVDLLVIYWMDFIVLYTQHKYDGMIIVQPLVFLLLFFAFHWSDTERDETPDSQWEVVNDDALDIFYQRWPARPYKTRCRMATYFCFGPLPIIESPIKTTVVLLGGWANVKSDYANIAYLLSQNQRDVVVLDYRGVGETGLGPDPKNKHGFYSANQYAEDIMHLIRKLFGSQQDQTPRSFLMDEDDEDDEFRDDDRKSPEYHERDQLTPRSNTRRKVYLVGLSMGANVAMQCALHKDAQKFIRGIIVCSGHGGSYLLKKGPNFENYGNEILSGDALHYGWCKSAANYMEYAHSVSHRASCWHRVRLRHLYYWRLSVHPFYCCNFRKYANVHERDRHKLGKPDHEKQPTMFRGVSKWFESKLSLNIRGAVTDQHYVVEGIQRQTDVAEDGFSITGSAHTIAVPTLIMYGTDDTVIHPQTASLLQEEIGENAHTEPVEGGGHNFWFEKTRYFLDTIEEWMSYEEELEIANGSAHII